MPGVRKGERMKKSDKQVFIDIAAKGIIATIAARGILYMIDHAIFALPRPIYGWWFAGFTLLIFVIMNQKRFFK